MFPSSDKAALHQVKISLDIAEATSATTHTLIKNSQFRPISEWNSFDSNKWYLGKIIFENTSREQDWVLEFSQIFTEIDLFQYVDDSLHLIGKTGTFLPPNQRTYTINLKSNLFKLSIPPEGTCTYFFKAHSERINNPLDFTIQLTEESQYSKNILYNKYRNSFYIGITFMLLVFSLILFAFGRDWSYIYYATYLLGIIIFTCYNSGDLADFLNASILHDTPQYIYLFKLVIYTSIVGYISFIRRFLNLAEVLPKWNYWFRMLSVLALPLGIIELILLYRSNFSFNYDVLNIYYTVAFAVTNCLFIIPLFRLKADTKALYVLLGTVIMGIGLVITAYLRLQSVDFTFSYFKVGSVFEFILFFLGLAYSQQVNLKEKEQAAFALEKNQLLQVQQQRDAQHQKELMAFKSRFYDNIAHDFKTPLTVIKGLAQLDNWSKQDRRMISNNADHIHSFVNQLLDLSKLESKKLMVQLQEVEIISFFKKCLKDRATLAKGKQQTLSLQTNLKSLYLDTDVTIFEKIICNLISNAVKYTPEKGAITITVEQHNNDLLVQVQDTGPGIPKELVDTVFNRYYQIDTQSSNHGSGLGLSIVKECTELLEGTISVEDNEGAGTSFFLRLPIKKTQPLENFIVDSTLQKPPITSSFLPTKSISEKTSNDFKPILLIIEDNQNLVYTLERLFDNQFHLEKAFDGELGLAMAKELIPDIIICDVMMPKMDGFQVCSQLKIDPATIHIPIIMVTAKSSQKNKIKGFRSGVDAFLGKPFDNEELMAHVKRLQNRQVLMQQWMEQLSKTTKEEVIAFPQEAIFQQENDFLKKVNIYLEAHKKPFPIKDLAAIFFIGERQFARKLKSITGYSPSKYIRFYKVFKARLLLAKKELQINQIAYKVGFENVTVFNRNFKEFYDQSPKELRKLLE